jgi:hypothetical protein
MIEEKRDRTMTSQTARDERKASNVAAHQARNDRSRADAAERRLTRRNEGLSRSWLHNARLWVGRLDALRAKRGMRPYQMTMEHSEAVNDILEGGAMLAYRVPMPAAAFAAALDAPFSVGEDGDIVGDFGHVEPAIIGLVDRDLSDDASTLIRVEYQIIDGLDGHAPAIEYQRVIRELHEHLATLGAEIVADEAEPA